MASDRPRDQLEVGRRGADPPFVLALDVGTSSVKAAVFDARARRISGTLVRQPYPQDVTAAGGVSADAVRLEALVARVLRDAIQRGGRAGTEARLVAFACFFHSLLGLDAGLHPVTPVFSWADTTSAPSVPALREQLDAAAVHARTGATLHPSFWPARLHHLRGRPEVAHWTGFGEWLVARATGRHRSTLSMASGTGLMDGGALDWDAELVDHLGIPAAALPQIEDDETGVTPGAHGPWPRGPVAEVAGARAWFGPWGDGLAGNVGMGCTGPRRASLMVGTSGAMRVVVDGRVSPPPGLFGYRWGRGRTLLGGALSEGGNVGAWVSTVTGRSTAALDAAAAALPAAAHGLDVLPFLAGERSPRYRPDARALVRGLTLATGPVELYRALVESVALRFRALDLVLTGATGTTPDVVIGGGAVERSGVWRHAIADALGRRVERSSVDEVSLRGAAILALLARTSQGDGGAAAGLPIPAPPPGDPVTPDPAGTASMRAAAVRQAALDDADAASSSR